MGLLTYNPPPTGAQNPNNENYISRRTNCPYFNRGLHFLPSTMSNNRKVAEVMRNQAPETYTGAWLAAGKNKKLADLIWEAALKRILRRSKPINMRTALRERARAKLAAKASQQCPWTKNVIVRWAKETTVYINRGQTILNLRPGDTFYRQAETFITVGKTYTKTWKKKKYAVTCSSTVATNP